MRVCVCVCVWGGGFLEKIPSMGEVQKFSGTTQSKTEKLATEA